MKTFDKLFNSIMNEELALHKIDLKPHNIGSASDKNVEVSGTIHYETGIDWINYIKDKFPDAHIEFGKATLPTKNLPYLLQAIRKGKVVATYEGAGLNGKPDIKQLQQINKSYENIQ